MRNSKVINKDSSSDYVAFEELKSYHGHSVYRRYTLVCPEKNVWWPDDYYVMGTKNVDFEVKQIIGPTDNLDELHYLVNNYDEWNERVTGTRWDDDSWYNRGQYILTHTDTKYLFSSVFKEFKSMKEAQKAYAEEVRKLNVHVASKEEAEDPLRPRTHYFDIRHMNKPDYLDDDILFTSEMKVIWTAPVLIENK